MSTESEIEAKRALLSQKLHTIENIKNEEEIKNQPLRQRMRSNKKTYELVYKNQKDTFFNYSVKKWNIPKEEAEDLFAEYFTEFENEKTNSIAQFLASKGFKFPEDKQGKIIIG